MVVLAELRMDGWMHEECNSGMVKLFGMLFKEDIVFAAEKTHLEAVKSIELANHIRCCEIKIPGLAKAERMEYRDEYYAVIKGLVEQLEMKKGDCLVILAATKCMLWAAVEIYKEYGIKLIFVMHSNMERFLHYNTVETEKQVYEEIFEKLDNLEEICFIAFHPYIKTVLKGILNDKLLERFYFFHLPVDNKTEVKRLKNKTPVVGVYGACVNRNFSGILKCLEKECNTDKVKFLVMRRIKQEDLEWPYRYPKKGMMLHQAIGGFTREERLTFMEQMDWILLPYDTDQYRGTMSAILADAIQMQKPILALNASVTEYYGKFEIGIVEDSIEKMCRRLAELQSIHDSSQYEVYVDNLMKLKQQMTSENVRILNGLMEQMHI